MKNSGFTIIEVLVALSILAIVLSIGAPGFKTFINSSNMVANSNGMIGAFNYARTEAVKRGVTVEIAARDGSAWASGIVVKKSATGEELRLWPAFDTATSVSSAQSTFSFQASGEVNNDDVLTICDNRTAEQGRKISILLSGAIIAEKVTCA